MEIHTIYYNIYRRKGDDMESIREVLIKNKNRFSEETHCLNRIAQAAIDHQLSMTQQIFEYCLDFYIHMDEPEKRAALMSEYPEFWKAYVNQIEEEISHTEIPEETPEQAKARWQSLCDKIRAGYGEDAI